jgi:hypothetical protein
MNERVITIVFVVGILCAYIGFVAGVMLDEWIRQGDDDEPDGGSWVPDFVPDDILQVGGSMPSE